jgi:hypothetical protein
MVRLSQEYGLDLRDLLYAQRAYQKGDSSLMQAQLESVLGPAKEDG